MFGFACAATVAENGVSDKTVCAPCAEIANVPTRQAAKAEMLERVRMVRPFGAEFDDNRETGCRTSDERPAGVVERQ